MPSFSSTELSTSLSEVGWGLTSWELLPPHFCPSDEARAKLELLEEGDSAVVGVSERGWKVVMRSVVAYEVRSHSPSGAERELIEVRSEVTGGQRSEGRAVVRDARPLAGVPVTNVRGEEDEAVDGFFGEHLGAERLGGGGGAGGGGGGDAAGGGCDAGVVLGMQSMKEHERRENERRSSEPLLPSSRRPPRPRSSSLALRSPRNDSRTACEMTLV